MECGVEEIDPAYGALPRSPAAVRDVADESGAGFTAADFFKQTGTVIAVCLGLAAMAQVLVTIVGQY